MARLTRLYEDVLLHADLLPQLLGSLQLEDGAVAAVCTAWRRAWDAKPLRRLQRLPKGLSKEIGVASLEEALRRKQLRLRGVWLRTCEIKFVAYIVLASAVLTTLK